MKKEDLFEGFGALDDELLKRSEQTKNKKGVTIPKMRKFASIAACFAIILTLGITWVNQNKYLNLDTNPNDNQNKNNTSEEYISINIEPIDIQENTEKYIDIATLLAKNEGIQLQTFTFAIIQIEKDPAIYHKADSVGSSILKQSIGDEVNGMPNWYKVLGHKDMQYLISNDNDTYSLWVFQTFQSESYDYNKVLKTIYDIHSANDIKKIIVAPANMDNTEEGKSIQNEIGISTITNKNAIQTLYNLLSNLICYGENHWEMIGLEADTPSAMQHQVRVGRYLTIITSQGLEIDTLKYTGISGMFYEYGGIAYNPLTTEEQSVVEEILQIK